MAGTIRIITLRRILIPTQCRKWLQRPRAPLIIRIIQPRLIAITPLTPTPRIAFTAPVTFTGPTIIRDIGMDGGAGGEAKKIALIAPKGERLFSRPLSLGVANLAF